MERGLPAARASQQGELRTLRERLRETESSLHALRQRYEAAMVALDESFYEWDVAGDRIWYSENMQRVLGLPRELLTSVADWSHRIHPDDRPRYRSALIAHLKRDTTRFECEYRFESFDGTWRWARHHGVALRDANGRAARMIGSIGDITELKQRESELRRSEERYALATSAAVEGIYEWDLTEGTLFLTDRAKQFFVFSGDVLTPAAWNQRVHGDDFEAYRAALVAHFKGREPILELEYRIADGRGGYKWVLDRGVAVRAPSGRVTKLVGALSDITERKFAEFELRRARDAAEEALRQQTATAEMLAVISAPLSDLEPVFDAFLERAIELCDADVGLVFRDDGTRLRIAATRGLAADEQVAWQEAVGASDVEAQRSVLRPAVVSKEPVHVLDLQEDAVQSHVAFPGTATAQLRIGTLLVVPLVKGPVFLGSVVIGRRQARPFTEQQIGLLGSFAAPAVIAIENVRLFNEIRESLEQQEAAAEVLGVIRESIGDTAPVFDKILESCQRLFAGRIVGLNLIGDDGLIHIGAFQGSGRAELERVFPLRVDEHSGSGLAIVTRSVVHYPDVEGGPEVPPPTKKGCAAIGIKSVVFAPMVWEGRGAGAIFVGRDYVSSFSEREIALLRTFADQAAIAIENVRLFNEIQQKSRQLQIANRHKSEFVANMSHELRTPLNAIIGFTRIVMRRSADRLEKKQYENLEKILASGQHLLGLINAILDLAKVEAGRVEIVARETALASVLEHSIRTVEPLVKGDTAMTKRFVDDDLPVMVVDEDKLRQIVINLLSNAVKFTPAGRIEVRAVAHDGRIEIAVADTGIGIPADKLDTIFEEFEQVDATSTRVYGGTGLGLAISRRLARLMNGDIRVASVLGKGSTFTLTLPLRYGS